MPSTAPGILKKARSRKTIVSKCQVIQRLFKHTALQQLCEGQEPEEHEESLIGGMWKKEGDMSRASLGVGVVAETRDRQSQCISPDTCTKYFAP